MSTVSLTPVVTKASCTLAIPLHAPSARIASRACGMPCDGAYPFLPSFIALWTVSMR